MNNKFKRHHIYKKLWKYARPVMEMERKLNIDPTKELLGVQEHTFKIGRKREAKIRYGV